MNIVVRMTSCGIVTFVTTLLPTQAYGQCSPAQAAKLYADDATPSDVFGYCDASGDTIVVGVPFDDTAAGENAGSVYVFRRIDGVWTQISHLYANDAVADDRFGGGVAIDGDTIVIGAEQHDTFGDDRSGKAYIFRELNGVWTQVATLVAGDVSINAEFGRGIDINNGTIAIGARYAHSDDEFTGAVYLFREVAGQWTQIAKLTADDGVYMDEFGATVAIDEDIAVVGARFHGGGVGKAYVYREGDNGWTQEASLGVTPSNSFDYFGGNVAVHDGTIVVGAINYDLPGLMDAGAAFVFEKVEGAWVRTEMLLDPTPSYSERAGISVGIDDDVIAVSSSRTLANVSSGALNIYRPFEGEWLWTNQLAPDNGELLDRFGGFPSFGEGFVATSAISDDDAGLDSGAVYVFDFGPVAPDCNSDGLPDDCETAIGRSPDCNGNRTPDACDIASGTSGDCNANSIPDECDIAALIERDCNVNGIPDDCEIAQASACDANGNGVPDTCDEVFRPSTPDANVRIEFGTSVGIDGVNALVGAPAFAGAGSGSGAVYGYRLVDDHWESGARLTAASPAFNSHFGCDLSLDGNLAIIGENYRNTSLGVQAGAAYIFENTSGIWSQAAMLTASDAMIFSKFGSKVAISGETAIVNAPGNATTISDVYVFRRIAGSWLQTDQIHPPMAPTNDGFGLAFAIDGSTMVIGASRDDEYASAGGAAYVYQEVDGDWTAVTKLHATDVSSLSYFGQCVQIRGDVIAIGAPDDNANAPDAGAVYLFRRVNDDWPQIAKLTAPYPLTGERFGYEIAMTDDRIYVGAPYNDFGNNDVGAVYVFEFDGAEAHAISVLESPTHSWASLFGRSIDADVNHMIVGAPYDNESAIDAGAAHIFLRPDPSVDCDGNGVPDPCEPPLGSIADFVGALLNASNDAFDICVFDGDGDGRVDGRDIESYVIRLIGG